MPSPTIKTNRAMTMHRDLDVSYWSVTSQQWRRCHVDYVPDADIAGMCDADRNRIATVSVRACGDANYGGCF